MTIIRVIFKNIEMNWFKSNYFIRYIMNQLKQYLREHHLVRVNHEFGHNSHNREII